LYLQQKGKIAVRFKNQIAFCSVMGTIDMPVQTTAEKRFKSNIKVATPCFDLTEKVLLITRILGDDSFKSVAQMTKEALDQGITRLGDVKRSYRGYLQGPLAPFVQFTPESQDRGYKLNIAGKTDILPVARHLENIGSERIRPDVNLDFLCSLLYKSKYPDGLFELMSWVYNGGKKKAGFPRDSISERNFYFFIDKYSRLKLFAVNKDFVQEFSTHPYTTFRKTELGKYLYKQIFSPIREYLSLSAEDRKDAKIVV
jgi:hypothetical protein